MLPPVHDDLLLRRHKKISLLKGRAFVPELEKVAEAGDGAGPEEGILRLIQRLKAPKKENKPTRHKKSKKICEGHGPKCHRHPPQWCPLTRNLKNRPPPMYPVMKMHPVVHQAKTKAVRSNVVRTPRIKTGNVISNVSIALETFKKKRDKFLIYLLQLQTELTELNLPSISSENMVSKVQKKSKKERIGRKQVAERRQPNISSSQRPPTKSQPSLRKKKLIKKKTASTSVDNDKPSLNVFEKITNLSNISSSDSSGSSDS